MQNNDEQGKNTYGMVDGRTFKVVVTQNIPNGSKADNKRHDADCQQKRSRN